MPKTIAITPSWFWPESIERVAGIPPFGVWELCVSRHARDTPEAPAIVSGGTTIGYAELNARVSNLSERLHGVRTEKTALLQGTTDVANVIRLLAALASGLCTRIVPSGVTTDSASDATDIDLDEQDIDNTGVAAPIQMVPSQQFLQRPAVEIPGQMGPVHHSHRSLLANAISMVTFLQPQPDRPWIASLGLDRWEGLTSVLVPLYLGVPLVLDTEGKGFAETIVEHQAGYAIHDLDAATATTRESKRAVKKARSILDAILLSTPGVFNPGDRQRVGKSYRCPALTFFGKPETGAIFASHPQWYLDESVGIPITNAHVVPSDPRNGAPIQALWELVESAEVTVRGPMLMCADDQEQGRYVDGRFRTGVIASSDANGMIYILPD